MSKAVTMWMASLMAFPMNFNSLSEEQQRQVDTVVATVFAEAGGEGNHGMLLVLGVILRRCETRQKTPYEVVTEPKQFAVPSSVVEMLKVRPEEEVDLYRRAVMCLFVSHSSSGWNSTHYYKVKARRFSEYVDLMNDEATHFFAVGKEPEYVKRMEFRYRYKGHSFWTERKKSSLTRK